MSTNKTAETTEAAETLRVNEKKWSKPLMAAGWTAIPSVIVERQKALGLDALDMNILLHLSVYWWTPDNKPHPAKGTIAEAVGVEPRTVQRRIAALESVGLIQREQRRLKGKGSKTNLYHFDGLIAAALPFAKEKLAERAEREAAQKATVARKGKPKLHLVKAGEDDE